MLFFWIQDLPLHHSGSRSIPLQTRLQIPKFVEVLQENSHKGPVWVAFGAPVIVHSGIDLSQARHTSTLTLSCTKCLVK